MINKRFFAFLLVFGCLLAVSGSAQAGLEIIEGQLQPHQKIGEIEVNTKHHPSLFWGTLKVLSIGLIDGPSRGDQVRKRLDKALKKAAKRSQADAVAFVQYYPDLSQESHFRHEEYYAKGVLIQYTKFPQPVKRPNVR